MGFVITDRTKAYQFGMRKRSVSRYRRIRHKFSTEMDGLNSNYLSRVALAIEIPGYSQTGELPGCSGRNLVLSEALEFAGGQARFIVLRRVGCTASGPYGCVEGVNSNDVTIDADLDFVPVLNGRQVPPFFMFGTAEKWCEDILIADIVLLGTDCVNLTAVNNDQCVYAYDDAVAPS